MNDSCSHLDVELQVLVHRVDVVEDVAGDARDDSHQLRVMQFALNTTTVMCYITAMQFLQSFSPFDNFLCNVSL